MAVEARHGKALTRGLSIMSAMSVDKSGMSGQKSANQGRPPLQETQTTQNYADFGSRRKEIFRQQLRLDHGWLPPSVAPLLKLLTIAQTPRAAPDEKCVCM